MTVSAEAVVEKAVMATGIGLVAGALTGGIGLAVGAGVGLLGGDMLTSWLSDDNPCRTALKNGAPPAKKNDPPFMNRPVEYLAAEFLNPQQ